VADRYRALLIGTSTYPADEHNLQTLKGPVKDIAALNRALIDSGAGLFADVDVTLLPEATSARAIRALGRFFGTAARDDILLVYFSGHGKLDQVGRLHLCMQDTESTDLLSTAVSSARISEFADASRARNVVIVLDCCYAGAFRGADLGDAVAGPGRYVLTSCRGTQLANDATVENGTSFFTQHLVDGLLGAAADQDGDGYVSFSDLYAYVDQRLREAGKQIPQRRVDGDGEVRLAKRPLPAPPGTTATMQPPPVPEVSPPPPVDGNGAAVNGAIPAGSRPGRARRGVLLAATAAAIAVATGVITALVLLPGGSGGNPNTSGTFYTRGNFVKTGVLWRLKIEDSNYGNGCSITVTDVHTGSQILQKDSLYGLSYFQMYQKGSFRWQVPNKAGCPASALPGPGAYMLPFSWSQLGSLGDTFAFPAPPHGVAVRVTQYHGTSTCDFTLNDVNDGQPLSTATATQGKRDTVTLDPSQGKTVYLETDGCKFRVSPAR
jgi:hypothetical protein